ncbi:MAG: AbrB/MazE/SpoVT family DNA-binding domain-containing protein [Gammaproteobacteria bacterium]|nr:AbrB/MazE/SpoVT family DNA-binding domain-containing protein [Gammaproteobacteria bacterium]MDE0283810.1 AbrB/MazE/SpoVT family DNA-binding domain-containing protein [Gammaproteobacteria bacterium]MDE0510731.1 AbrB/MazE/SpoVT family DNA-binding domain-containing protein [Gammaproteobacteria bacterium]
MQATITSKGQVTIPKPIRDKLHLKAGDKVEFMLEEDGNLRIAPVTASVTQLKGMLSKPAVTLSITEMNEAIATSAARKG